MHHDKLDLPIRIVMDDPVPGVRIGLQKGKAEVVNAVTASTAPLVFDFEVNVNGARPDGEPRLLGPYVQGPPTGRFVYLCVGRAAGQIGTLWNRRTKIPLVGLTWPLIDAAKAGGRLEAHIAGRARDGGPACASVPLLPPGWRVVK